MYSMSERLSSVQEKDETGSSIAASSISLTMEAFRSSSMPKMRTMPKRIWLIFALRYGREVAWMVITSLS